MCTSTMPAIHVHQQRIPLTPVSIVVHQLETILIAKLFHTALRTKVSAGATTSGTHFLGGVLQLNKYRIGRTKCAAKLDGRPLGYNIIVPPLRHCTICRGNRGQFDQGRVRSQDRLKCWT